MNCPACGRKLQWSDGAFCDVCTVKAKFKIARARIEAEREIERKKQEDKKHA